jgi:hypothetical protein
MTRAVLGSVLVLSLIMDAVSAGRILHLDTKKVAAWVQICFILALNVVETDCTIHLDVIEG